MKKILFCITLLCSQNNQFLASAAPNQAQAATVYLNETPLYKAIDSGNLEQVKSLLDNGANTLLRTNPKYSRVLQYTTSGWVELGGKDALEYAQIKASKAPHKCRCGLIFDENGSSAESKAIVKLLQAYNSRV